MLATQEAARIGRKEAPTGSSPVAVTPVIEGGEEPAVPDRPAVRDTATRIRDACARLESDDDCWVASSLAGVPWLVPLSFVWTGEVLLLATPRHNRTYRGVEAGGGLRIALGATRDVVMVDGDVDRPATLEPATAEAVARRTGVDPRQDASAGYLRLRPRRIQAWRTPAEVPGRTIMRDGRWMRP